MSHENRTARPASPAPTTRGERLAARLAGGASPLVLDGATGTELERAGLSTGLPLWSTHALLEAPECVFQIHASYLAAGAEIVTANTFRTQERTLARGGLAGADARLTRLAVDLARRAVAAATTSMPTTPSTLRAFPFGGDPPVKDHWVAGSLPPLEDCYRPDLVPDDRWLATEHERQADLLGEGGVDLILIETMNTIREAQAAARAAARTGLPFVVSFVAWDAGKLLSGESLEAAARAVLDLGAAVVGVNCLPMANMDACRRALSNLAAPLLVSPNLGGPEPRTGFARDESNDPARFPEAFTGWLEGSAAIVGGCCGTTPAHIAALAARVHGAPGERHR